MTLVRFISKDRMLRSKYLYENRMFTNKVKQSIIYGMKGKDRVILIERFINARVGRGALRCPLL